MRLYELLTGSTPFDKQRLATVGLEELRRIIREEEPEKPSTRLVSLAAQRRTEPIRLRRLIRGELDWIVMKALEKDRTRRYQTASDFARDVQRYLADEPVEACPPSAVYRLRKFGRKYKSVLGTAAAFVALLIAGVIVSSWLAMRAMVAEGQAQAERQAAHAAQRLRRTGTSWQRPPWRSI